MLSFIKRLHFYRNYTTKQWSRWWEKRKIDWRREYMDTWEHPHRNLLSLVISKLQWFTLLEVGCGAGANLINLSHRKKILGGQMSGIDINNDAIETAKKFTQGLLFKRSSAEDIIMSDSSIDIVFSDMTLVYFSRPNKVLKEIKRVARDFVVFSELHSSRFYDRVKLLLSYGLHAYDYKKLLEKHGFYNIQIIQYPPECWEGEPQRSYAHIIIAKVPKRK